MGLTFQARLRSKADQTLETTYYDGTKRHFSFEKYAETLQRAFVDLQSTQEEVSEERKVHVLLNGILDPRLEAAKNQVIASEHLQSTFEIATNFLNWALDSKISYSTVNCKSRISTVTTGRGGGHNSRRGRGGGRGGQGFGRGKGKGKIWHDYYTNEEWQQLTAPQKQQVRDQRAERNKCRNIEVLGDRIPAKKEPCLTPTLMDEGQARNPNTTYNGFTMEFWKFALTWKLICQVQHK